MTSQNDREAILYSFASEPAHDRTTLDRYVKRYPDLKEDLVDLSAELRLNETIEASPGTEFPDPGANAAWSEFVGSGQPVSERIDDIDLFTQFRGATFAALATSLNIPRSILSALRNGLVVPSSIPSGFARRFAAAASASPAAARATFNRQRETPVGLAFKADTKPAFQGQRTFRELVLSTPMSDDQRALLLHECDEDERL